MGIICLLLLFNLVNSLRDFKFSIPGPVGRSSLRQSVVSWPPPFSCSPSRSGWGGVPWGRAGNPGAGPLLDLWTPACGAGSPGSQRRGPSAVAVRGALSPTRAQGPKGGGVLLGNLGSHAEGLAVKVLDLWEVGLQSHFRISTTPLRHHTIPPGVPFWIRSPGCLLLVPKNSVQM